MTYECILKDLQERKKGPMTEENVIFASLLTYLAIHWHDTEGAAAAMDSHTHGRFTRQMAEEWTRGMENADGTKGPHWDMEQTEKVRQDHKLDCDPVEFWAVMNSLYSDYCEALKKNNASTMETYVYLAKAWIHDTDAVPNKAAAYYTYIVEH